MPTEQHTGHFDTNGDYHGPMCVRCMDCVLDPEHAPHCSDKCKEADREDRAIARGGADDTVKDGHDFYMKRGAYGRGS